MRSSVPRRSTPARPERVVVINLARRQERLVSMAAQLRACGWQDRAEFFRAYDALELDEALLDRMGITLFEGWQQPRSSQMFHARPIKLGEVGCALSHLSVWRMIAARGWQTTLVLEDDVVLPPTVAGDTERLLRRAHARVPGWHLLYLDRIRQLGAPFTSTPPRPEPALAPGLVKPSFSYCAHAYVLSLAGARRLLDSGFERSLCAVDEFLPALYCRHPRADVRAKFGAGRRLVALAAEPALLRARFDGSDTDASGYLPGATPPRYRWAAGRRRVVDEGGQIVLVVGKTGRLRVVDGLRDVVTRLIASARPSAQDFVRTDPKQVLQIEHLLARLTQLGMVTRLDG